MVYFNCKKLSHVLMLALSLTLLMGFSSSEYTRKDNQLPNVPEGNPDPSLGIVIHPHSTGIDVLRDSSQNIRFRAIKNYDKTDIEILRSSSIVDRTPKKFKFIDEEHGFSSNNTHEFTILFSDKNLQWKSIRFMPFNSVIEWVTEEKLKKYLEDWVNTFEKAGWKRVEYPKSDDPRRIQNFRLPTSDYNIERQYCSWMTGQYEAVIRVRLRYKESFKNYASKAERKSIKNYPDGYIAFITITKNSQYK